LIPSEFLPGVLARSSCPEFLQPPKDYSIWLGFNW
jgi:hypothetical protein